MTSRPDSGSAGARRWLRRIGVVALTVTTVGLGAIPATERAATADGGILNFSILSEPNSIQIPASLPIGADVQVGALADSLPSVPMRRIPMRRIPMRRIPMRRIPMRRIAAQISLSRLPLERPGGWTAYLAGTPLAGTPLQQVTLEDVLAMPSVGPELTFEDIDISSSALGNLTVASVALGETTLRDIGLSENWATLTDAAKLAAWCANLGGAGASCSGVTLASTLTDLDLAGVPMRRIVLGEIPMRRIDLVETLLRYVPMRRIRIDEANLAGSPMRRIPMRRIADAGTIFDCNLVDCSNAQTNTATIGDAVTAGAVLAYHTIGELIDRLPDDTLLGDVLSVLIDTASYPWDEVPFDKYPPSVLGNNAALGMGYLFEARYEYFNGPDNVTGATVSVQWPAEWGPLPTADITAVAFPSNTNPRSATVNWTLVGRTATATIPFAISTGDIVKVRIGATIGPQVDWIGAGLRIAVTVNVPGTTPTTNVNDPSTGNHNPAFPGGFSGSTPDQPRVVTSFDQTYLGMVYTSVQLTPFSSRNDGTNQQFWSIPRPAAGRRLVISVTGTGDDVDLVAYRPVAAPVGGGVTAAPMTQIPVGDADGVVGTANATVTVPSYDGLVPVAASFDRGIDGEHLVLPSDLTAPNYLIRVSKPITSHVSSAYRLYVHEVDQPTSGVCPAVPALDFSESSSGPTIPTGTNAIVLTANARMQALYGATDPAGLAQLQQQLALLQSQTPTLTANEVVPAVVDVSQLPGVAAAYTAWNAQPCDPDRANAVVDAIRAAIRNLAPTGSALRSVTVVGADNAIPQARLFDASRTANETTYTADSESDDGSNNPISAALRSSHFLSDDPYGDSDPIPWLDRYVYIPDIAVGRLVETPGQIASALSQFLTNNGVLDPQTAHVAGYDFLADGSTQIESTLTASGLTTTSNIDDGWTGPTLSANVAGKDVVSIGAHADHFNLLPNASNRPPATETGPPLNDQALPLAANSIVFSMGCHGGMSVPDTYGFSGDRAVDWAQAARNANTAIYVGNTGFGYGNSSSVALTERLMVEYAKGLDGSVSAGDALMLAKQRYYATMGAYGGHDEKALQESTLYGLPFWSVTGTGQRPAMPAPRTLATGAIAPSTVVSTSTALSTTTTADGQYDSVPGSQPQITIGQPVIARESFDVTQPTLVPRGVVIEDMQTSDRTTNALIAGTSATDGTPVAAEPGTTDVAFPTTLATVNSYNDLVTDSAAAAPVLRSRAELVVARNQFIADSNPNTPADTGTMRQIQQLTSRVYYADPASTDVIAPHFVSVTANPAQVIGATDLRVETSDSDTVRIVVLVRTDGTNWTPVELVSVDGKVWTAQVAAPVLEYFVQAVDSSGNVATDMHRGVSYSAGVAPTVNAPAPITAIQGEPVRLTTTFGDTGSRDWTATIDWGEGNGPEIVTATNSSVAGTHTYGLSGSYAPKITVCDEGQQCSTVVASVATAPPLVSVGVSSVSILEGDGTKRRNAPVLVSLAAPQTTAVSVKVTVVPFSATAGTDYVAPKPKTLTFLPGQVAKPVSIPVVPDALGEGDEAFAIELSNPVNAMIASGSATGGGGVGVVTIVDDDGAAIAPPRVHLGTATVTEGNSGKRTLSIPFSVSTGPVAPVAITVTTTNGSATSVTKPTALGGDYVRKTQRVVFSSTVVAKNVAVILLPDIASEGPETFTVSFTPPTGYTVIGASTVTITVNDDD